MVVTTIRGDINASKANKAEATLNPSFWAHAGLYYFSASLDIISRDWV